MSLALSFRYIDIAICSLKWEAIFLPLIRKSPRTPKKNKTNEYLKRQRNKNLIIFFFDNVQYFFSSQLIFM